MVIKSFRGKINHGAVDQVVLHTNTGSTGYRIVKFQLMAVAPAAQANESIVKIFKIPQTESSVSGTIDFADNTLLAAGFLIENSDARYMNAPVVIFDNEVFNQDIYLTYFDQDGNNGACNYYIELEQIKLDLGENTVATLKDIRNIEAQPLST
jgi:hypothetical protein